MPRDLHTERRADRAAAAELVGTGMTAGYSPDKVRLWVPAGLDPNDLLALLAADLLNRPEDHHGQPDPPAPPAVRYWVPGLDDGIHDPSDPRYPPNPNPPPPNP